MERYTVIHRIGNGNMGLCNLVKSRENGNYYVIKQINMIKLTNKKERQQSLNEAKVLGALRHPNVIKYVDSFLERRTDHLCIVMEYADGGDIWEKIKRQKGKPFTQNEILDMFIQTTLALQYIHRKKVLHRDVKTQNIFLTEGGVCKLGDFGISKALTGTYDQANTFLGTPYYFSPEMILERPYDHMSDIWALGVVLYELITLNHPFNARDMKTLMQRILRVQYDPIPHYSKCSKEIKELVPRLLVKDPTRRIRLKDVLSLPAVTARIMEWLQGLSSLPSSYVASLLDNNLLPASILSSFALKKHRVSDDTEGATQQQLPMINGPRVNEMKENANSEFLEVNENIRGHVMRNNTNVNAVNKGHATRIPVGEHKVSKMSPGAQYQQPDHISHHIGGRGEMGRQHAYHLPNPPQYQKEGYQLQYHLGEGEYQSNNNIINNNRAISKLQPKPQNIFSQESNHFNSNNDINNQHVRRFQQLPVGERALPSLGLNVPNINPNVPFSYQRNIPSANPIAGRHYFGQLGDINIKEKLKGTPVNRKTTLPQSK